MTTDAADARMPSPSRRPGPRRAAAVPVDDELRPAAPGHAHHAAAGAEARRRAGGRRHARHRLPALRLREARRAPRLQPVRHGHRPDELRLADGQQRGLAPGGGEAAGDRGPAAVPVHPGDRQPSWRGSATTCCASGRWGSTPGPSRYFIYAFNPREQIYDIFEALCGARFTNSYTRVGGLMYDASPKAIEMIREFLRGIPQGARRHASGCSNRNRIFVDRTKGIGVLTQGGGDQPQLHRADRPGQRRDPRPAQGRAVPGLPRLRFPGLLRHRPATATPATWSAWRRCEESMKIVQQAMENLPAGPVNVGDRRSGSILPEQGPGLLARSRG